METLPLPLLQGLTFEYTPLLEKVSYEQSAVFEIATTSIRNKPRKSVTIGGYIPKQYFLTLDTWLDNWDGNPFSWNTKVWVCTKYDCQYVLGGLAANITLVLVEINN